VAVFVLVGTLVIVLCLKRYKPHLFNRKVCASIQNSSVPDSFEDTNRKMAPVYEYYQEELTNRNMMQYPTIKLNSTMIY